MGEIRQGYLANLLFVKLQHPNMWPSVAPLRGVCFSALAPAIDGLMVAGKWVGQRGNFQKSITESEVFLPAPPWIPPPHPPGPARNG